MKPRIAIIHWWRARKLWSVRFSDHCEHYKRLEIRAPLTALLSDKSPRAFLKGKIRVVKHGTWAEIL